MPEVNPDKKILLLQPKTAELRAKIQEIAGAYQDLQARGLAVPHTNQVFNALSGIFSNLAGLEPIRFYYDWPKIMGRFDPWAHQKSTAAFMCTYKRGFVLNEQRTGKTNSSIWAIDYLKRNAQYGGVLVFATKSTVRAVWEQSILQLFPSWNVYTVAADRILTTCAD